MVSLGVIVRDVLGEQVPEMSLGKRNHAIETFGLRR
jgi:hypothetical protein